MSMSLATKGMIGDHLATSGEGYPVIIKDVEVSTDEVEGPFLDAAADMVPITPSSDGSEILPSSIKIEGMERIRPRLNPFPNPTSL